MRRAVGGSLVAPIFSHHRSNWRKWRPCLDSTRVHARVNQRKSNTATTTWNITTELSAASCENTLRCAPRSPIRFSIRNERRYCDNLSANAEEASWWPTSCAL
eukprot:1887548-Pyramimonas_sp.AAC.1